MRGEGGDGLIDDIITFSAEPNQLEKMFFIIKIYFHIKQTVHLYRLLLNICWE